MAWEPPGPTAATATPVDVPASPAFDAGPEETAKSRCASFPAARSLEPLSPCPPRAMPSSTLQLAQPGRGPKRMPSADTRPHGLKGSQGKPDPPDAGEAVATHSTKCWHLHPYPGRQSADAAGGDLPFPPTSWLGTFITAKDLVRGIKTFFSRYLIFCCCCFLLRIFFFGVLYSSIIFHLFIPSVDMVCTMYNGSISESKNKKIRITNNTVWFW